MNDLMTRPATARTDREGFALATTVLVVLVLTVLAVAVVFIASAEKRTSFAEGVHVSAVFSADAGGESAINFIRRAEAPPLVTDFADSTVAMVSGLTVQGSQSFDYDTDWAGWQPKPGWNAEFYRDFNYDITSTGAAAQKGRSEVTLRITRLYKMGY